MNEKQEQMVLDNLGLIYHTIKKLNLTWQSEDEWQDYYDCGLLGLINGVRAFKDNKGMKPSTFLIPCIENEIKHLLVAKMRYKRFNQYGKDISLNKTTKEDTELVNFVIDKSISIEQEVERKIEIENIIHRINKMKNIKDALVLKMYFGLEGFTSRPIKEISQILKVSDTMIRERYNRGLENLKKELEIEWIDIKTKH